MFFFFNDTATTEIYTLSLHDALPIFVNAVVRRFPIQHQLLRLAGFLVKIEGLLLGRDRVSLDGNEQHAARRNLDRKSTRLNSSHANISYAVFCLKKKKKTIYQYHLLC